MEFKDFIDAIATLGATFIGASLAFKYEERRQKSEQKQRNIAGYNRAMFSLGNMLNVMQQFDENVLQNSNRANPLNFPPTPQFSHGAARLDLTDVQFLLQSDDHSALENIMIEERRFFLLISLIEDRSILINEIINPKLAAANIPFTAQISDAQFQQVVGQHIFIKYLNLSKSIVQFTGENITSIKMAIARFHSVMKTMYPEEKFLKY